MGVPAIAGVSLGLSAAGSVIGGLGAQQSADAQASAYRYKAGVALLNKQINEQNAQWALQAGETQAVSYGMKAKQEIAQTKVAQGASGLDVNSGSAEAVRETQSKVAAFDQNVIRWDAAKTAYGYQTKATMDVAEANLDRMAASQSEKAGRIALASSFISGAANVASKWTQGQTLGIFGGSSSGSNPYYGPLDFNG